MMSVERLVAEHEHLDMLAGQLEEKVASEHPDVPATLALKSQLSVTLAEHLQGEDAGLYTRLARSTDQGLADTSATFRQELDVLRVDWSAYLDEWCDDAVESDWSNFADETRNMMARLRARIARENGYLFPLALQGSELSLRAG